MSDPPPETDDVPVHESLSRIIKICKDSLETISTLDSITGCDLVRKIKDEGSGNLEFAEECLALYDGSSSILKNKDLKGRTVADSTIEFKERLSSLPSRGNFEDYITGLETEVSRLQKHSGVAGTENQEKSVRNLVKRFFQKSLTKKEENYQCSDCPEQSPFESFKGFQRHRKTHHSETVTSENLGARDEYKCLLTRKKEAAKLCLKKIKKVDICRHLKLAHEEARPKGKEFKGYFTFDKIKFTVAWGDRTENFPDEEMIEIEGDPPAPIIDINVPVIDGPGDDIQPDFALVQNVETNDNETESLPLITAGLENTERIIEDLLNIDNEVMILPPTTYGAVPIPEASLNESAGGGSFNDNIISSPVNESLLLTIDPNQIHVSTSENNPGGSGNFILVNASAMDPGPHDRFLKVPDVPEVAATEEITSSPPFFGFSESDAEKMKQKSILVQNALLSSSMAPELDDPEVPEFDVVVPMEITEPCDALASSLEYPSLNETFGEVISPPDATGDPGLKESRYSERKDLESITKLSCTEGNSEFIEMFKAWIIQTSGKTSTLDFKVIHNFTAPDSFLNWFTSKCPGFTLMRLISFNNDASFISLPNPAEWLKVIGGPSGQEFPDRRHQCVNAYKRLLAFVRFQLNLTIFDGESIVKKRAIKEHIKDIQEITEEMNFHRIFRNMAEEQKAKKNEMSEIINPTNEEDKLLVSENWFGSEENRKINEEAETIWKKSMERGSISKKDFNRVAKISFLETAMSDKLRRGVYSALNNRDWSLMKDVYLPAGYDEPTYEKLPKGWKVYEKPKLSPTAKPSRFEIRIPGTRPGIKNKQRQVITLNLRIHEILKRFQDIKRLHFKSLPLEEPFFINYEGESLPPLRNYDGSLLNLVGRVTGIRNFTLKDTRKSLDSQIQSNPALKVHIKELNSHSEKVGALHYDRLDGARRSILNHCINQKEGSDLKRASSEVCEEIQSKRAKHDEQDRNLLVEEANEFIDDEKKRQPKDLSPTALVSEDINLLCSIFKDAVKDDDWKSVFYSKVDSTGDIASRLQEIEKTMFRKIKDSFKTGWSGSTKQNEVADAKISVIVKKLIESEELLKKRGKLLKAK